MRQREEEGRCQERVRETERKREMQAQADIWGWEILQEA